MQVCDAKARQLTNEQRSAVAEYFSVSKGNEQSGKKACPRGSAVWWAVSKYARWASQVRLSFPLHPSLQRAHDTVLRELWLKVRHPDESINSCPVS